MKLRNKYRCNGPRVTPDSMERQGCGYDLTPLIQRIPQDGKEYSITCPECGEKPIYRQRPFDDDFDESKYKPFIDELPLPDGVEPEIECLEKDE